MEETPPWSKPKRQRRPPESVREAEAAVKNEEKRAAFLQQMQDKFDKDRETLRAELEALLENESMRPAIEAIMKRGMCECAGAHGNMCAWVLMTWFAAEAFRAEHGEQASTVLASMGEDAISSYVVDARVEIKVLRRFLDSLIYAQARSMKQIPELDGDVEAQLETAASGAWRCMDVSWPPQADGFDENRYLSRHIIREGLGNGQRAWSGSSREEKLNNKVMTECGMSHTDVRKLDESKVIGENNITDAPARLLARRVASASSGKLASLESRDDGLSDGFGVDVGALTKLIDSMKGVVEISKAVRPLGHILCSCPTPPDPPPAPPAPQPTNVNDTDPRNAWTDREWDEFAQQHG